MDRHLNPSNVAIESSAVSDRGLSEKRPQNEDSYLEMTQIGIFAVADGVGGAEAGEVASQMAVEILGEAFANRQPNSDAEMVMRLALEQANSAIHQMSNDLTQLAKMATTVVALHIDGNVATIGHVGDSRVYRIDSSGALHRETEDHSMVADEVRAGRMTEEQAENHPGKNIINRALGAEANVEVELKTIMVDPGTTFLLCSDGITRHIGDVELSTIIAVHDTAPAICQHLKDLCFQRGAEDNLTAVVVRLGNITSVPPSIAREDDSEPDFLTLPDMEESTQASARFRAESINTGSPVDDEDLLELETKELHLPSAAVAVVGEELDQIEITEHDLSIHETVPMPAAEIKAELDQPMPEFEPPIIDSPPIQTQTLRPVEQSTQPQSIIDRSNVSEPFTTTYDEPSKIGRILSYFGLLLVGIAAGLGIYHYLLKPVQPLATDQLTEMRSSNVPLSAFEENRRDVDKDPANYLTKNTAPQDCEDYYLIGRAYLLTADYPKARAAFAEARKRIAEADPINRKTIESDIAISMAVTNDTTIQGILKKELEPALPAANTANSNK